MVDVAVTVTVSSDVDNPLVVPLPWNEDVMKLLGLEEPLLDVESDDGGGVGAGKVMIDWEESVWGPTALLTGLLTALDAARVSDPSPSSETIVSDVTAESVVLTDVAVPSPTLISITLAVTVAAGARGTS